MINTVLYNPLLCKSPMNKQVERKRYGFYKKPAKMRFFTWLTWTDAVQVDELSRELQIGSGTLLSWISEEILHNEDLLRFVISKIKERIELPELQRLSMEYRQLHEERPNLQKIACKYCRNRIPTDMIARHESQICPKRPVLPQLGLISDLR